MRNTETENPTNQEYYSQLTSEYLNLAARLVHLQSSTPGSERPSFLLPIAYLEPGNPNSLITVHTETGIIHENTTQTPARLSSTSMWHLLKLLTEPNPLQTKDLRKNFLNHQGIFPLENEPAAKTHTNISRLRSGLNEASPNLGKTLIISTNDGYDFDTEASGINTSEINPSILQKVQQILNPKLPLTLQHLEQEITQTQDKISKLSESITAPIETVTIAKKPDLIVKLDLNSNTLLMNNFNSITILPCHYKILMIYYAMGGRTVSNENFELLYCSPRNAQNDPVRNYVSETRNFLNNEVFPDLGGLIQTVPHGYRFDIENSGILC